MKQEDFERLKAVCEKEGFELLNVDHKDNEKYYVIAKKKKVKIDPNNYEQITECLYKALEKDKDKFRQFLASQLEKYLNGEATD